MFLLNANCPASAPVAQKTAMGKRVDVSVSSLARCFSPMLVRVGGCKEDGKVCMGGYLKLSTPPVLDSSQWTSSDMLELTASYLWYVCEF